MAIKFGRYRCMKGTIKKRGSTYTIIIDIGKGSDGKRKQKWYGGYKRKKDAEKDLVKLLHQLETNSYINPDKITLGEYLNQWMADYVETNLAPKTIEGYRVNIERHIIPSIGGIVLQKLQPIHIQQFYKSKLQNGRLDGKGGLSAKSIIYIHRNLREALNHAVKLQLIQRNVADAVEVPRQKVFRAKFLTEKQIQDLLKSLKNTDIYIPVLLAVGIGLRRGEALGLKWKDIDFENKTITVTRSLLPSKNGLIFHDPKTEHSKRVISVSESIMEELKKHQESQEEYKKILGQAYNDNDLVCCLNDGSLINPASFSHRFSRTLEKSKLPHVRFHDLRHTNATLMLKHNIPAKVASERLGHSNIGITLDLYSHVMKEMQEDAARKLDNAIFKKGEKENE